MKPIYNNDGLEKYRQVNGSLNAEGQRIFCDRMNAYLDQKDKDKDKEIERLQHNQEVSTKWEIKLTQKNTKLKEENKRLKSIIKEVREYIKQLPSNEYIGYWKKEIFEILEKVEEK